MSSSGEGDLSPTAHGCEPPATRRRAGLLCHVGSLSTPGFGQAARELLDFLDRSGLSVWQMLPLGPTHPDGSPYLCLSSFALEPSYLDQDDLAADPAFAASTPAVSRRMGAGANPALRQAFDDFRQQQALWLEDYASFMAIRRQCEQRPWQEWPAGLRDRDPDTLRRFQARHAEDIDAIAFEQFLLDRQWQALRQEARRRSLCLFGDLPIFVAGDSADVWANQSQFLLDGTGHPTAVAGVPPDYFSASGQRWGNPLFDFERMAADGFSWWRARLQRHLQWYDWVRIDHFRGLSAYWAIPATDEDATQGEWKTAPGEALLEALMSVAGGALPLVAEDLGVITPEVTALRDRFGLPGMTVLQFAFDGGEENPHLPDHHRPHSVAYTGTHDNDTTLGWWQSMDDGTQATVRHYLQTRQAITADRPMPAALIDTVLASEARLAMLPVGDLLSLGSEGRINVPGTAEGNWCWQLPADALSPALAERTRQWLTGHDRLC